MKKMMKSFLLAAAAVAAISCAKELAPEVNETPAPEVELMPMTFTASSEGETKVSHDGDGIVWNSDDEIAIISGTSVNNFKATEIDGSKATFTGWTTEAAAHYAVYPASAVSAVTAEGVFDVVIPAVQTAVHGSFDPSALVAVTKADDENNLMFKNIVTMVKFRLSDPENVKSVRFTAVNNNGQDATLASIGTINAETNITSHAYKSGDSKMITLNAPAGGFKADTDYYLAFRTNDCRKGFTFYFEYNNGTIKKRSTSNPLFGAKTSGFRNQVRNLKTIDIDLTELTPYDSYQLGFDLVVGDKVYNKAVNGDAVKVTADATSMYTAFNKGGIRFLDPAADGAIVLHSTVAVTSDAVLVGNVNNGKVRVDMNGKNVYHTAKTVALKNLELDTDAYTNYVFANINATADADAFILDNCSVTGLVKPLWYVNVEDSTLKELTMVNTDVALAAATNIIDLSKTKSDGNESVTIKNCILYGASNYVSRIVNNSQNLTSWTADVVFNNNTVYNLHAGTNNGLLHMAGANSVEFKNNLVNFYSLNSTEYVIRIWKNTPTYTVDNNHFWARAAAGIPQDLTFYSDVKVEAAPSNITSGAYPFTSTVPGAGATR